MSDHTDSSDNSKHETANTLEMHISPVKNIPLVYYRGSLMFECICIIEQVYLKSMCPLCNILVKSTTEGDYVEVFSRLIYLESKLPLEEDFCYSYKKSSTGGVRISNRADLEEKA